MVYLLHENGSRNSLWWPRKKIRKFAIYPGLGLGKKSAMENKMPKPVIHTDVGSEFIVPL